MLNKLLTLCAVVVLVPVLDAAERPPEYLLGYRFHTGEVLRWNVQETLRITTCIKGEEGIVETQSISTKIWTTLKADDPGLQKHSAVFEYKVGDVRMKQFQTRTSDTKEAKYDSRKDKKLPQAFSNLEGTIGVPLAHLTVDKYGNATKKMLRRYSPGTENRIVILLPEKPVWVGYTWEEVLPLQIDLPDGRVKKINARRKYTLQSVQSDIAKIVFTTAVFTVLTPTEESQIIDNYASGSLELDIQAGHIIRQQSTVEKRVIGFYGKSDSIHHQARRTECCCGLKSCELCN